MNCQNLRILKAARVLYMGTPIRLSAHIFNRNFADEKGEAYVQSTNRKHLQPKYSIQQLLFRI